MLCALLIRLWPLPDGNRVPSLCACARAVQVLAEANSAASEALGNIRTVRAFSTEDVEVER